MYIWMCLLYIETVLFEAKPLQVAVSVRLLAKVEARGVWSDTDKHSRKEESEKIKPHTTAQTNTTLRRQLRGQRHSVYNT